MTCCGLLCVLIGNHCDFIKDKLLTDVIFPHMISDVTITHIKKYDISRKKNLK